MKMKIRHICLNPYCYPPRYSVMTLIYDIIDIIHIYIYTHDTHYTHTWVTHFIPLEKKTTTNLPKKTWFQDIRLENSWVFFIGSNRRFLTFDSKAEIIFEHFGEVTEEIRFATCSPPVGGPPQRGAFSYGHPPQILWKIWGERDFFL